MKIILKNTIWLFLFILIIANLYIFVSGINLGVELSKMETEINQLNKTNMELENKFYQVDSLGYAASMAASLGLDKTSVPYYLESLEYAFNR